MKKFIVGFGLIAVLFGAVGVFNVIQFFIQDGLTNANMKQVPFRQGS